MLYFCLSRLIGRDSNITINSRASTRLGATFSYYYKSRPLFRVGAHALSSFSRVRTTVAFTSLPLCTDVVTALPSALGWVPPSHHRFRRPSRSERRPRPRQRLILSGRMRVRLPLSSSRSTKTPAQRKVRVLLTCATNLVVISKTNGYFGVYFPLSCGGVMTVRSLFVSFPYIPTYSVPVPISTVFVSPPLIVILFLFDNTNCPNESKIFFTYSEASSIV